jgi:hypothetical protein
MKKIFAAVKENYSEISLDVNTKTIYIGLG